MKDEPMTACYRIFAKVEECDDSITDILKKICERSGCVSFAPFVFLFLHSTLY